eukprot:jgi/Mesvir1/22264/Mv18602-RA.1
MELPEKEPQALGKGTEECDEGGLELPHFDGLAAEKKAASTARYIEKLKVLSEGLGENPAAAVVCAASTAKYLAKLKDMGEELGEGPAAATAGAAVLTVATVVAAET